VQVSNNNKSSLLRGVEILLLRVDLVIIKEVSGWGSFSVCDWSVTWLLLVFWEFRVWAKCFTLGVDRQSLEW